MNYARRSLGWFSCAVIAFSLNSCSSQIDVLLLNDAGGEITVSNPFGKPQSVTIQREGTSVIDVLVVPKGIVERFSIFGPKRSWTYWNYLKAFETLPESLRDKRTSGRTRLHARIDRHGYIDLLSETNESIKQPAGFPLRPAVDEPHE